MLQQATIICITVLLLQLGIFIYKLNYLIDAIYIYIYICI